MAFPEKSKANYTLCGSPALPHLGHDVLTASAAA